MQLRLSLRRSESSEVNGRKSESMNRLPSKKGGREAPKPVLINDEMQLRASVTGSVCRWSQVEKQKASRWDEPWRNWCVCECCLSFRSWHWMSPVAEVIHACRMSVTNISLLPCILLYFTLTPSLFPLSSVTSVYRFSSISFSQCTPSNSSPAFSIPHSIFPACLLLFSSWTSSFFFLFSHASLHPPTSLTHTHRCHSTPEIQSSLCPSVPVPLSVIWQSCLMSPASAVSHR